MTSLISIVRRLVSPEVLNTLVLGPNVRFIALTAPTQEEALDEAVEIDWKASTHAEENVCKLRYAVGANVEDLRIWVEPDPGERAVASFYGGSAASILFEGAQSAGVHELQWEGRDATGDQRLILGGVYLLKASCTIDGERKEAERRIKVAAPSGWNIGMDYRHNGTHWLAEREVDAATSAQQSLSDGTAYRATGATGSTALETMTMWQGSAIGHFGGHSSASGLDIHEHNRAKATTIYTVAERGDEDDVILASLGADALRDTLLLVLAGCNTGNEVQLAQRVLMALHRFLDPQGVDGAYGNKTKAAMSYLQAIVLLPRDGLPTPETMAALGLPPVSRPPAEHAQLPRAEVFPIQRKLLSLAQSMKPGMKDPRHVSGRLDAPTQAALRAFQETCGLEVTGMPDQPTLLRMQPGNTDGSVERNPAEAFVAAGCDVALGFQRTIDSDHAERWSVRLWDLLSQGKGVMEGAQEALQAVPRAGRAGLAHSLYAGPGVDSNLSIMPARFGRGAPRS